MASYLWNHVTQLLFDRDPHRVEDTRQYLYRSANWRKGPVTMAAIAAVDMALLEPELPLLHAGHHRRTPIQAVKFGRSLESYDLYWPEDVTPAENQDAFGLIRQHTTTSLAVSDGLAHDR